MKNLEQIEYQQKEKNYTWLICAAQNMKNIVTKVTKKPKNKDNGGGNPPTFKVNINIFIFF